MSLNKDLREKYQVKNIGIPRTEIPPNSTGYARLQFTFESWLSGVKLILENQNKEDTYDVEIHYKSGETYIAIDNFGENIPVITDRQDQGRETQDYWGKIPSGLYFVVKYKNTGISSVFVKGIIYRNKEK